MSEPSGKSSSSGTNIARIIFVVIIVIAAAVYYMSLPQPPPADFKLTGSFGFDVETADPEGPMVKTVRVESLGGFNSPVTLSLGEATPVGDAAMPSGITAEINPTTVTPAPDGIATVEISWTCEAWAEDGSTYEFMLTAVSGDITHEQTYSVRAMNIFPD